MSPDQSNGRKLIASNRKRGTTIDPRTIKTGIVLQGGKVKSLRLGHVQIADASARVLSGTIWLDGMHVPPYTFAHGIGAHDPDRSRKLLLHAGEIDALPTRLPTNGWRSFHWRSTSKTAMSRSSWRWVVVARRATNATRWRSAMHSATCTALGRQAKGRD